MVKATDIHSLTDFQRNTKAHLRRLKASGKPKILTVNGRSEVVVLSAAAYQELIDSLERAEAVAGIRKGLESVRRGRTVPLKDAEQRLRRKHGLSR